MKLLLFREGYARKQRVRNASRFDRRLFRSKVVSIDKSRFDRRQESFRSKTGVISIEDCNYCSKCIQLTIYQICLKIFPDTVKRRSLSFFHRYIVRDISLARYFWECFGSLKSYPPF